MAKIVILPALESKLFDLVFTLHDKEYFGFVETAIAYVDDIINFIHTISLRKHKKTLILQRLPTFVIPIYSH